MAIPTHVHTSCCSETPSSAEDLEALNWENWALGKAQQRLISDFKSGREAPGVGAPFARKTPRH